MMRAQFEYKSCDLSDTGRAKAGMEARMMRAQGCTWASIANRTKCCQTNLYRWQNTNFRPDAVKSRKEESGRPRNLSSEQEDMLMSDARQRRREGLVVDLSWIVKRTAEITEGRFVPSLQWSSKFLHSKGWSSLSAIRRDEKELRPTMEKEIEAFIADVKSAKEQRGIGDDKIWAFDETAIVSGCVSYRTFVDPDTRDRTIVAPYPPCRDTLIFAASQSGDRFAKYITHQPERKDRETGTVTRAVKGVQIPHMLEFIDEFAQAKDIEGAILIEDNLSVHKNKEVKAKWAEKKVDVKDLPPQSGRFANPLDRNIIAVTKSRLIHEDTITPTKKEEAVMRVVDNIPRETITKCFAHCGY